MTKINIKGLAIYLLAFATCAAVTFPFLWMLSTSLKQSTEVISFPPTIIPSKITFEHFRRLFTETNFINYLKNSIIIAGGSTLLSIIVACLAGYALARFKFKFKAPVSSLIFVGNMVPPILLATPYFILMSDIGLVNSMEGLTLTYLSFNIPFCVWLLRAFFQTIPLDLEESAMIDGCSRIQAFARIVLPQAVPGIVATSVFAFIGAFNEFTLALLLIQSDTRRTVSVGLNYIATSKYHIDWELLMSGSVIIVGVLMVFFIIIQRWLIKGWGTGTVKG